MKQFLVEGPLSKTRGPRERSTAFDEDGLSIVSQYARCRSDTEPTIHCFELHSGRGNPVGFLGLALSEQVFDDKTVGYSCVEYIFIKPGFRGRGLSTHLLERALYAVCLWLEMLKSEFDVLEFQSWATFQSSMGLRVVVYWDLALRAFCGARGIEFWAASLAQIGIDEKD